MTRAFLVAVIFLCAIPARAADDITILLDWFVNPDHAPIIIAEELGYFENESLNVEIVPPADPSAPPRLVAAKQAEIAVSYQPNLHMQVSEGLPISRVGTLVATPLNSLVVLKDGPIKSISDLKGKTVGFSVGGFEDALLGAMLERKGLSLDDVTLINVNFSLSPSLYSGQVDAVIGAFRNFELNQMEIEERPGLAFYPEEEGVPIYDELIYIAHKDHVNDPRFPRLMRALEQATTYILNHPDDALSLFLKAYPDLDDELNNRAWYDTLPRFAIRPAALDHGRYHRFAEFMKERGLIENVPALDSYAIDLGEN